jgi:hypothetical protein
LHLLPTFDTKPYRPEIYLRDSFYMSAAYHMQALTAEDALSFCKLWLPARTGNDPARLASFYTEDLSYSDPSIRRGVTGKKEFFRDLEKLLRNNPNWVWSHAAAIPLQDGFLNKWRMSAPVRPGGPIAGIGKKFDRIRGTAKLPMQKSTLSGPKTWATCAQ